MEQYGAEAIIINGFHRLLLCLLMLAERIKALTEALSIKIGFHAHNNLGLICLQFNCSSYITEQTYVDACMRGFGAGAGNTPLEVLIPVLEKYDFKSSIRL